MNDQEGQSSYEVCEVCRILDRDLTRKPCRYCATCQEWICEACIPNYPRRAIAAARKKLFGG